MTETDLSGAHIDYRGQIGALLADLQQRYPWVPVKAVRLYDPEPDDRSLAVARPDGEIRLNAYWFSRHPQLLQASSLFKRRVLVGGRELAWHGPMIEEPAHVITHEFGHILSHVVPGWERWAKASRTAAIINPAIAPSAYGLHTDDEFWGEAFAMYDLGFSDPAGLSELIEAR